MQCTNTLEDVVFFMSTEVTLMDVARFVFEKSESLWFEALVRFLYYIVLYSWVGWLSGRSKITIVWIIKHKRYVLPPHTIYTPSTQLPIFYNLIFQYMNPIYMDMHICTEMYMCTVEGRRYTHLMHTFNNFFALFWLQFHSFNKNPSPFSNSFLHTYNIFLHTDTHIHIISSLLFNTPIMHAYIVQCVCCADV